MMAYVGKFREKVIYKIIVYNQLSLSNPRKRALKKKITPKHLEKKRAK